MLCRGSCIDVLVYDRRRAGQDNGFAISTRPTNKWGGPVGSERCPFSFSNLVSGAGARTGTSVCFGSAISQQRWWLDMREQFSKSGPFLISEFLPLSPFVSTLTSVCWLHLLQGPSSPFQKEPLLPLFHLTSPPQLPGSFWPQCMQVSKQSMVDAVCCPAIFHGNGARLPEEELPLNISGIHAVWTTHTACRLDGILVGGSRCGAL